MIGYSKIKVGGEVITKRHEEILRVVDMFRISIGVMLIYTCMSKVINLYPFNT